MGSLEVLISGRLFGDKWQTRWLVLNEKTLLVHKSKDDIAPMAQVCSAQGVRDVTPLDSGKEAETAAHTPASFSRHAKNRRVTPLFPP